MINYLPNDPLAVGDMPLRKKKARPNRPSTKAGLASTPPAKEAAYPPGSAEFLYWQARESALSAIAMWESLGVGVTKWARSPNPRKLQLVVDHVKEDLNAYYDGDTLSFFHATTGAKTTFSGASTDVVAHEVGHALLDIIRPQLWAENFTEAAAFHEAFGDCVALLTALHDKPTRQRLLKVAPTLRTASFVEALMEDLADGTRRGYGASSDGAAPRHALNTFKWTLPTTLPAGGPPAKLTRAVHSFWRA